MTDPRTAYCPLLRGNCGDCYDCDGCSVFQETLQPFIDDLAWICSQCFPRGRQRGPYTLIGFYTETDCYACGLPSIFCQAAFPSDYISREEWIEIQKEIMEDE